MNTSLSKIAAKYLAEIEAAEPGARAALINELDYLVTVVGKLGTLSKVESAAESAVGKVEGALEGAVAAVEKVL